jgi:hypothetical protein
VLRWIGKGRGKKFIQKNWRLILAQAKELGEIDE